MVETQIEKALLLKKFRQASLMMLLIIALFLILDTSNSRARKIDSRYKHTQAISVA
jgi:hypothetical protein